MSEIISVEEFSRLTGALYEGLQQKVPWKSFLHSLQEKMDANFVTFIIRPPSNESDGLILSTGHTGDEVVASYNKHFFAMDPFVDLPSSSVVTLDEFIPESERKNSDYVQQFLAPMNVHHILGTDINTRDGAKYSLRISRSCESAPFTQKDKEVVSLFVPHLQHAIDINHQINRVETERDLYAGAVDQLAVGTIILDEEGKVIQTNHVAQDLIQENDGLKLTGHSLQVGTSRDTRKLRELIKQALSAQQKNTPSVVEALRIQRPSGKSDLGIVVRSVPTNQWAEGKQCPSVVIFVSDPDRQSQAPQEIVKALFDLTPAEAQLAMLLANGLTLDETSEQLCISRNTARAHLRSIFSKTGVTRQTMLVRLILKSVATLG
ncbi:helix-turn-helix transcriptional regulator [Endozoicomonas numazuensis]|uniref:LuxR family transcriptional regulator n=1 Tax=Endozoicomonas numazuensis TaxID=1137799 RepID=A0A081NMM1_9GAMM|nr:helix-turn-helix transcriptional regulator [Endozoicomonas numazuensis]KEQ19694.1 LuxR family transcriptional regulator [Endozoicomonas numazuensis]